MSEPASKRGTGRTTRMLNAAFRRAFHGARVAVVIPNHHFQQYCMMHLRDLGAKPQGRTGMIVPGEGVITFYLPDSNPVIMPALRVEGYREEDTFFDHETVYRQFRHVVDEYQKYDKDQV